ncbi:MAG: relaxase domain-containing protein, partial [Defluviicoccus sp.]|nr:relaxase domain-containing protein [Defluviicoccus sp.]
RQKSPVSYPVRPGDNRRRPRVAADGLVAATFRHLTSRDQDPQLHTHCILANMTRNRAGDWRSMEPTRIRRSVKLIGAYYRQELARRLMDMGFRIETTMIGGVPGFEIAGYPRPLLDEFSSRRREILSWLEKHGLPYSKALTQQAALITRARKAERGLDELKAEWTARAEKLGVERDISVARPGRGRKPSKNTARKAGRPYVRTAEELAPEPPGLSAREIVWRAVEHLSERASVFRESDVRAMALSHAPGRYGLAEIDAAVTDLLGDGHLVEAQVRGGRSFVTGDALRSEREILSRMREGKGAAQALASEARVTERLQETTLTAGQKEAVRTIVLSDDRIVAVQGAAGTGKTTMLREALGLMGERPAILLAPSAAAARVLAEETGARARTLQWFLTRYGDIGSAEKMQSARREHDGSVLVLDESSMVSTAQMELLMRIAERLRIARLVLVGVDPRALAGAERLAERAAALDADSLPEDVRRTVAVWTADAGRAAAEEARRDNREQSQHEEAGRRIAGFLRDCREHIDAGAALAGDGASTDAALDGWLERAETLRSDGLRMLGAGAGARLDDPARIRLAGAAEERDRVRDAVDALEERALGLRAAGFMDFHRRVGDEAREAGRDPADLPAWERLRARAEALRDEPGLAAATRDAARSVLAHHVQVETDTAPVAAFLEAGTRHLDRRAGIDRENDRSAQSEPDALSALREDSADLRETGRRLLGQSPPDRSPGQASDPSPGQAGDAAETRAASCLEHMPHLRERVEGVLDRLETQELRDRAADFRAAAASVEARAREDQTLPLHAEGYGRVTEMAQAIAGREEQPASARREAGAWLDRDREWQTQLATARELTGQEGRQAERRVAAQLPAVAEAIRRETHRLARLPPLERGIAWTGDAPLIAGDRIAFRAEGEVRQAVVDSPGASGGLRESDTLRLRIADPREGMTPAAGRLVEIGARTLAESGCVRAAWSDAGLRELELARQRSVPAGACRTSCPEPVPGDRIAWTETAGPRGEVRTIEAEVQTRTDTADGYALDLRVVRANGPGAPEPGSTIGRTVGAVTARGCFRATWTDEARRERILRLPERKRPSRQQEENRQQGQDRSKDRGFSM